MKLSLSRFYDFRLKKKNNWRLCLFVESRSGRLNPQTGQIIALENLDEIVEDILSKLRDKSTTDIRELRSIPQTLEMYVSRIWEMIDDSLPPYVRLIKIQLFEGKDTFVEYSGLREGRSKKSKGDKKDGDDSD